MVPDSWFIDSLIVDNWSSDIHDGGTVPRSALLLRLRVFSEVRRDRLAGSVPEIELNDRSKYFKYDRSPIIGEMLPFKNILLRSMLFTTWFFRHPTPVVN